MPTPMPFAARPLRALALILALAFLLTPAAPAAAASPVEKPVRTLIGAVRYDKDALALKHLAGERQGEILLGDAWDAGSAEQRAEFVRLFHTLFAAIAFPKIRENFEHLETIVYKAPELVDGRAHLDSTLVILHPMKKEEMQVRYTLEKVSGAWKVLDVEVLGVGQPSFLTMIREDQVKPLFGQGGWDHLLSLMRARAEQVKAKH